MKTLFSILLATLFLGFTACKKNYDYTCKCKFQDGKPSSTTYYSGLTKEQAENNCASNETSINNSLSDSTVSVTCTLK